MTDSYGSAAEVHCPCLLGDKICNLNNNLRHQPVPLLLALPHVPPGALHVAEEVPLNLSRHVDDHLLPLHDVGQQRNSELTSLTGIGAQVWATYQLVDGLGVEVGIVEAGCQVPPVGLNVPLTVSPGLLLGYLITDGQQGWDLEINLPHLNVRREKGNLLEDTLVSWEGWHEGLHSELTERNSDWEDGDSQEEE